MDNKRIFFTFISWRILLLVLALVTFRAIPLQPNFLGGGVANYTTNPLLWLWANFDGEHYLAIAREGYRPLTYFFFPVYPLLTSAITRLFGSTFISYLYSGLLVSHVSLIFALIGLTKLVMLEYKDKVTASWTIYLLLAFPTAFYLGSMYTESLFLALSVWSVYFYKKNKFVISGILGGFSSATRIFGLALIPLFLVESYLKYRKTHKVQYGFIWTALLTLCGLGVYSYYLFTKTGDPFEFFNSISIFGEQRSNKLIFFPQVFYRYIFKIIPALNFQYFPVVFTTFLEFTLASAVLGLVVCMYFWRMYSYAIYSFSIFVITAFSGSFSSFPRYVLSIFPIFIFMSVIMARSNLVLKTTVTVGLFVLQVVALTLFARGYWVS